MKKLLVKTTSSINATIEVNVQGEQTTYTLKSGSLIAEPKKSLRDRTLKIRGEIAATNNITTIDYTTTKPSEIGSLVMGSNVGGGWFLSTCKEPSTTPQQPTSEAQAFENVATTTTQPIAKTTTTKAKTTTKEITEEQLEKLVNICERTENLFKEIDYQYQGTPIYNDRVENSFYNSATIQDAKSVFYDYALVIGAPVEILEQIEGKTDSLEFGEIWSDLQSLKKENKQVIPHKINKRLEIYFGAGGTGKTTRATMENPSARVIVASATQDPSTLFGEFDMTTKTFKPSAIAQAMQNGETIIIDEFMLYSDEVLERFQAITDEKSKVFDNFLKQDITIKDGFKIIATMNLLRPLPSALATRANFLNFDKQFKATTKARLTRLLIGEGATIK